jgi:hypothetical protein
MKGKVIDSILIFLMVTMFSMVAMVFSFRVAEAAQVQGAGTKIPPEALMTVPPGVKNRKSPVPFPHAKHKDMDCTVCHHNAYETLLMSKCSAEGCHSNTKVREGLNHTLPLSTTYLSRVIGAAWTVIRRGEKGQLAARVVISKDKPARKRA